MSLNVSEIIECVDNNAYLIFSVVLSWTCCILTLFGNGLILVSVFKFRFLRTKTHILIANLAVADLLVGVSSTLPPLTQATGQYASPHSYMCKGSFAMVVISLGCSVSNFMIMSFERCMSLVFPMWHRTKFTRRKLYALIALSWILQTAFGLLPFCGWVKEHPAGHDVTLCIFDFVWSRDYVVLLMAVLAVWLLVNSVFYGIVIFITVRTALTRNGNSTQARHKYTLKKKTKLTMAVFGAFVLCWFPYLVGELMKLSRGSSRAGCLKQWFIYLGYFNSAINWAIYGLTNAKFRYAFYKVLRCERFLTVRSKPRESSKRENAVVVDNRGVRRLSSSATLRQIHVSNIT